MTHVEPAVGTDVFRFKRFGLRQGDPVWKAGTDSILLGCWSAVGGAKLALDMGTGTGLLAMMLAQRAPELQIDAVEISDVACLVAQENIEGSPWGDRIRLFRGDVRDNGLWRCTKYDLIIANPPYFPDGLQAADISRRCARQGSGFSLMDLSYLIHGLLEDQGKLALVMPAEHTYRFIETANACGLYVHRRLIVRHRADQPDALVLLEMGDTLMKEETTRLVLFAGNLPTPEYRALCSEFLLF